MHTTIPLLILAISSLTLPAQEPTGPTDAQTPAPAAADTAPILRTARLTWFHGDLQIQRTDNTAATPTAENPNPDSAVLNMPISEGSRLVTGDNAEAEIEFEDGSVVRLTPKTALSVDSLTVTGKVAATQLSLLGGLAYFELRQPPPPLTPSPPATSSPHPLTTPSSASRLTNLRRSYLSLLAPSPSAPTRRLLEPPMTPLRPASPLP